MDFNELISQRYSVRKFRNEHLPGEIIDELIEASHKAPTGCNYQPQRILVLNNDESMNKLKECTKCHFDAPSAMLICHNKEESWKRVYDGALSSPVDAVIVTSYIMLASQNLGVGSCWVMHFDPVKIRESFNIPECIEPVALLMLGYPSEDSEPLEMHYKYRDINEVVFFDKF